MLRLVKEDRTAEYLNFVLDWLPDELLFINETLISSFDSTYRGEQIDGKFSLAVLWQGRLVGITPATARDLARPVVVCLSWESPLERKVDLTVDGRPLVEVAKNLAILAGADLIMPSRQEKGPRQQEALPQVSIAVQARPIRQILKEITSISGWDCNWQDAEPYVSGLASTPEERSDMVTIETLFVPTSDPTLAEFLAPPASPPPASAQTLLDALRAKLPAMPVRPLITLRPLAPAAAPTPAPPAE